MDIHKNTFLLLFILFLIPSHSHSLELDSTKVEKSLVTANPTRPSVGDNANIVSNGYFELEFGGAFQRHIVAFPMLLKSSINDHVEIGIVSSGLIYIDTLNQSEKGMQDPGIQVKSKWFGNDDISIASVAKAEWINHSNLQYTLYGVLTGHFSFLGYDATLGGALVPGVANSYEPTLNFALAIYPKWDKKINFYAEFYGAHSDTTSPLGIDAGISYAISSRFIIDTAFYKGLNAASPNWQVHTGFTWTVGRIF